ncbi:DUF6090 family protein [Hyphococcus sp.]|jgi:hypothetical protein|uniref:DUF6090 family protein n=1 Tax=Hyphococcus sp. TaxID=2038636 RepID=UPI003D1178B1
MILRRVIEHVKDQNWTAIALDFVIVVVGVFIGIQVSNWNAARADRETERIILSRLKSDFSQIVETEQHYLQIVERAEAGALALLDNATSDKLPEDTESLCAAMNPPRAFRPAPPPSATYEQLVANGDMRLITDEPLRLALAEFESQRNQHVIFFDMAMATSLTLAQPFWHAVDICDAALRASEDRFAKRVGEMVASPEFAGAVSGLLTQHRNALRAHRATKTQAEHVLSLLEGAVGP